MSILYQFVFGNMHAHHRDILFITLSLLVLAHCQSTSDPPNVVIFLADDLGWNDIGYHNDKIITPTIDRLAHEGIKLENYYVQPMCTPSRAALLSGRYPLHLGLQHEVIYAGQRSGLPLNVETLADQLKKHGYQSHIAGKWHLGFYSEDYMPLQRGFSSWLGYLGGNEGYYNHVNCEQLGCGYDFRSGNELDYHDNGTYSTYLLTERAKQVIEEHAETKQPMFLYMPYQAVHFPLEAPQEVIDKFWTISDPKRRIFAAMNYLMDESIENITALLKVKGMMNNTIIIFSTDNGGEPAAAGSNWPLRGKKWTLWEGGVRGVSFINSPLIPESRRGTKFKQLMHISDWYPTIIEGVLGQEIEHQIDGFNMWESLCNGTTGPRIEIIHNIDPLSRNGNASSNSTFPSNVRAAIRVGDWKLITGAPGDSHWYPPFDDEFLTKHEDWLMRLTKYWDGQIPSKSDLLAYDWDYHTSLNSLNESYQENPYKNIWLFNITADPEELSDRSAYHPKIVLALLDRLNVYFNSSVPPNFPGIDPTANPSYHNGTWGPWVNSTQWESDNITHVSDNTELSSRTIDEVNERRSSEASAQYTIFTKVKNLVATAFRYANAMY